MEQRASPVSYEKTNAHPTLHHWIVLKLFGNKNISFCSINVRTFSSCLISFHFISLKLGLVVDIIILQTPVQTKLLPYILSILLSSGDESSLEISTVKAQHGGVDGGDVAVSSESESFMVSEQRRYCIINKKFKISNI